jgi:hypothetical protein
LESFLEGEGDLEKKRWLVVMNLSSFSLSLKITSSGLSLNYFYFLGGGGEELPLRRLGFLKKVLFSTLVLSLYFHPCFAHRHGTNVVSLDFFSKRGTLGDQHISGNKSSPLRGLKPAMGLRFILCKLS